MDKEKIFRKVSIERLSSPDQLDQLLQVVSPKSWVALTGFGLIIVALFLWGFTGSIPTSVSGQGVLIQTGGVSEISATGSGRVADIAVRPGEVINAGQVVARIQHPELEQELASAEAMLKEIQTQQKQVETFSDRQVRLQLEYLARQHETVKRSIAADTEQVEWLEDKILARSELLEQGLITRQQLVNTRQQLRETEQRIERQQAELQQIEIDRQSMLSESEQSSTSRAFEIEAQRRVISQLRERLRRRSRVVSPDRGRAVEIRVQPGDQVQKGQPIISFSRMGRNVQNLEAVVYVTAQDGKRVKPGMTIQISPATVKPEEYGRMLGLVTYVSDYPATTEGMMQLLGNQQLVANLSAMGAPYEVYADILLAPETESGYRWTSSSGPPEKIQSGTLAASKITVAERRPAELVLPTLREIVFE